METHIFKSAGMCPHQAGCYPTSQQTAASIISIMAVP